MRSPPPPDLRPAISSASGVASDARSLTLAAMKTTFWRRLVQVGLPILALVCAADRVQAASDEEILAAMNQQIAAIKAQMTQTQDGRQRAALQKQLMGVLDDSLNQVSPEIRPFLAVGLKLMQPLMADAAAYQDAAGHFFQGDAFKVAKVKSHEDIAARLATIAWLDSANGKLLGRINSVESDAQKQLADAGLSQTQIDGFMQGLQSSFLKKLGAMRAVRGLDGSIFTDLKALFTLLDQQWGKWHLDDGGNVVFDNKATGEKFAALLKEIGTLAERETAAERVVLQSQ